MSNEVYAMLSVGDSRYVDEDYDAAIEAYSQALPSMEQVVDEDTEKLVHLVCGLSHRAAAYLQIGKASEAFDDATSASTVLREQAALSTLLSSLQKEQIHSREGQAALVLGRFEHAMEAFSRAAESANESTREKYNEWLAKCQQKIDLDSQKPKTAATPAPVAVPVQPAPVPAPSTSSKSGRPIVPKYQYYQNDNFMTISILEPNVKPEQLNVTFGLDHLTVILTKSGKKFTVICGTLFGGVNIEKCKTKFMDEKVLIKLKKLEKHEWRDLFGLGMQDEKEEEKDSKMEVGDIDPETGIKKVVPTMDPHKSINTPYASQRDWGAIERDLKEQEKNEKPEGEEAMNVLFKDVYSKADEDTKRAMIKSFQTSGGTVLSTNWDDVSKTDYEKERQAPKGMEWKSWEGKKLPQKDTD